MTALRRTLVATASLAALVSTGLVATAPLAHAVSATAPVVITEVYGGGGNSGATYRNDFIELTNTSASPVDLTGWSVQYAASTGTTWSTTPLSGQILPGQYYLVAEAAGTGGTTDLPTPDVVGTIPLSGGSGKVALVSSAAALSGCAAGCSTAAGVVDFVGYGSADDSAGGHPAPGLSNPTSAQRDVSASNTADNATDFAGEAPTPKAPGVRPTGGTPNPCDTTPLPPECTPGPTSIQDIQGPGFVSPLKGQLVSRVPGVVTAKRANGYWMQQVAPDATLTSTSSGVFVFTSSAPSVSVGDAVLVSATVSDFYQLAFGETVATTASLSVTELTTVTALATLSKGNPLPAPLALTPTTVPTLYAPTVAGGNVESISPVDASHSALEFWEAHEGMLVSVNDARVVGPGKPQFSEIYVTTKPDELATPRGGTYLPSYAGTPSGRLLVSPTSGGVPAANVGDILTGATTGPVDWSAFGGYDIAATTLGTWTDNHLQPTSAVPQADDQLAIATYNVENLAPADPQSKYDALGAGVVTHLASPDVIAVEEIQDNSGAADDGVVAADATIAKLTAAISAAGGPAYSSASIDPVNDADGGQPGGNIRSVFLYNPGRVTFVSKPGGDSTTPVTVSTGADGSPQLSASPGRVDPANAAWTSSRKPLAGQFVFGGKTVIVVANHFNSKGGDQTADGRFQPPNRSSEVQRTQQATVLNGFVKQVLDADARANVVLAGDFNDYQFSGPVTTLTDNGATLTDLITTLPEDERYTYNFNGISQVLDHIFVSRPLTDVQYDVVHINSEFSAQTSDHDPQVVRIRPVAASTAGTVTVRPKWQHAGRDVTVNLQGWGPKTLLTISLDGTTTLATYTTKQFGRGSLAVTIPASTPLGAHGIVVTAPDGSSASASINVSRACPAGMGPGIFALSTEGPVRPSPLEPAGELQAAAC